MSASRSPSPAGAPLLALLSPRLTPLFAAGSLCLAAAGPFGLAACERDAPNVAPYVRPTPRVAAGEASCDGIARARQADGAAWLPGVFPLRIDPGSSLAISDPSVLGGPFEPPLSIEVPPGDHTVRVLAGKGREGPRPLCAQVRVRDGEPSSWVPAGDVAIDTDMLALVDLRRALTAARSAGAQLRPGIDAPADDLPRIAEALGKQGLPLEPVMQTFWCSPRALLPGDAALVKATLRQLGNDGRFVIDPAQPAAPYLRALRSSPAASVVIDEGNGAAAVAVDVPRGDGAYVVSRGLSAKGETLLVEIRLE